MLRGRGDGIGAVRVQLAEHLGVPPMHAYLLAGQHLALDGLLGQCVTERVAGAVREDHLRLDRLAQQEIEIMLGRTGDRCEQVVIDVHAACGHGAHDASCPIAESFVPSEHEVAERIGKLGVAQVDELFDEEGDAAAAIHQGADAVVSQIGVRQQTHLLHHLVGGERSHLDAHDRPGALELCEHGAERMETVDVVGAVGRDDREMTAAEGGRERLEKRERRGIRPLQIFDHDHEMEPDGEVLEHRLDDLGELQSGVRDGSRGLVVETGDEGGERRDHRGGGRRIPQRIDAHGGVHVAQHAADRAEGRADGPEVDALPDRRHKREPGAATRRLGEELADEPRLADPCLAAHDRGPRRPGVAFDEGIDQGVQLGLSPDHAGTRCERGHAHIVSLPADAGHARMRSAIPPTASVGHAAGPASA